MRVGLVSSAKLRIFYHNYHNYLKEVISDKILQNLHLNMQTAKAKYIKSEFEFSTKKHYYFYYVPWPIDFHKAAVVSKLTHCFELAYPMYSFVC